MAVKTKDDQLTFDFRDGNGPVPAHQHSNGGGWVADTATVEPNARVSGDARVSGAAHVSGDACVYGDAHVYGAAHVSGAAHVCGDAHVSKQPVVVTGLRYLVAVTDTHLIAGCECHTFEAWRNFSQKEITAMDGSSATEFYPTLLKLLDITQETR